MNLATASKQEVMPLSGMPLRNLILHASYLHACKGLRDSQRALKTWAFELERSDGLPSLRIEGYRKPWTPKSHASNSLEVSAFNSREMSPFVDEQPSGAPVSPLWLFAKIPFPSRLQIAFRDDLLLI